MKVLLVRIKPENIFARLKTVCFEPLELEYLAAAVNGLGFTYAIYDGMIAKRTFGETLESYRPAVVCLTGYTIHVEGIKAYAQEVKRHVPRAVVVVGGIHAELNWEDFYDGNIDVIVYADPVQTFRNILRSINGAGDLTKVLNICYRRNGHWHRNSAGSFDPELLPLPDRRHLKENGRYFRYFGKERCALVKTAWGCAYNCNFCYCAQLNGGRYSVRSLEKVIQEIKTLPEKKIFIIDDDFLTDGERVRRFCALIEEAGIVKNFSIYGRADLICKYRELLPGLKKAGIREIIVGLEALDDQVLAGFNKQSTTEVNLQAVDYLKEAGISCTGLFIIDENYGKQEFKNLVRQIFRMNLDLCMFSIFTPLKGVPGYSAYQAKRIIPEDHYEKADFLHLTIKPGKLSIVRFYREFYLLYLKTYLWPPRLIKNFKPLMKSLGNLIWNMLF
ncbi:MAG: B12-binding domain-containing radical SAM protein [Peptococcaceae bacterium]